MRPKLLFLWNVSHHDWEKYKVSDKLADAQQGIWRIRHAQVDEENEERLRHVMQGRDPGTGTFVCLQFQDTDGKWRPMMSDTRAEILEHIEVIDTMAWPNIERVLIHGLGLGVVLNAALSFKHIKHIDVVEMSQDVIDLVGPTYASDPRVTIHHGNAFTYKFPPNTRWDVVWHDIWPTISSTNLPEMTKLKRRYGGRTLWQGCWGELECRQLHRLENMTADQLVAEEWKRFEAIHGRAKAAQIKAFLDEQLNLVNAVPVFVTAQQPEEAACTS